MRSLPLSSPKIPVTVLILMTLAVAFFMGSMTGSGSRLPVVFLVGIALIILGIMRWEWLLLVFTPLVATWSAVNLGVGFSFDRIIAIPAFAGFALYVVVKKPTLPRVPAGGVFALTFFLSILAFGLYVNPSGVGFTLFFRLIQKIGWCYILFVALTQAGLKGLRRFGFFIIVSMIISSIMGIVALQHFGSGVRLTSITTEGTWELIRVFAVGIAATMPMAMLPAVEMALTHNPLIRVFLFGLMGLFLLIAILTTVDRWILVISPAILIYILFVGSEKQKGWMIVGLIGGLYVFYGIILPNSLVWQSRYQTLLTRTFTPGEARYSQLQTARDVFNRSPVWGLGLGNSQTLDQAAASVGLDVQITSVSHNSFMSVMIDVGVLGILGLLALWGSLAYGIITARRGLPPGYLKELMRIQPMMLAVLAWVWTISDAIKYNFSWMIFAYLWATIWVAEQVNAGHLVEEPTHGVVMERVNPQLAIRDRASVIQDRDLQ